MTVFLLGLGGKPAPSVPAAFGAFCCSLRPAPARILASMTEITERLSTALADRYVIEREIGAGGMATVYLAEF